MKFIIHLCVRARIIKFLIIFVYSILKKKIDFFYAWLQLKVNC